MKRNRVLAWLGAAALVAAAVVGVSQFTAKPEVSAVPNGQPGGSSVFGKADQSYDREAFKKATTREELEQVRGLSSDSSDTDPSPSEPPR